MASSSLAPLLSVGHAHPRNAKKWKKWGFLQDLFINAEECMRAHAHCAPALGPARRTLIVRRIALLAHDAVD